MTRGRGLLPSGGARVARGAALALAVALAVVLAVVLAGCGSQSVTTLDPGAGIEVGILLMTGSPGLAGWPLGDAVRVSVVQRGRVVDGAEVRLGGVPLIDRGAFFEPDPPPALSPESLLAIDVSIPGFARRDTARVPFPARLGSPRAESDLSGCADVAVEWSAFPEADGAWVVFASGSRITARGVRDVVSPSAIVTPPAAGDPTDSSRIGVLALTSPIEAFRPDAPLPDTIPAGAHVLSWTDFRAVQLLAADSGAPVLPDTLTVAWVAGIPPSIAWSPDTAHVERLIVAAQFFAEGNLRWEIAAPPPGLLPPVSFGELPAGAHACFPNDGVPAPLTPGVEYLIEVAGRHRVGRGRGVPVALR